MSGGTSALIWLKTYDNQTWVVNRLVPNFLIKLVTGPHRRSPEVLKVQLNSGLLWLPPVMQEGF